MAAAKTRLELPVGIPQRGTATDKPMAAAAKVGFTESSVVGNLLEMATGCLRDDWDKPSGRGDIGIGRNWEEAKA